MGKRHDLPSTYYRVSLKALIFDDQRRLLVFQDKHGEWEVPGGGWEHNESTDECIKRELAEEVGAIVLSISQPQFVYVDHEPPGYYKLSIIFEVSAKIGETLSTTDDLVAKAFVDRITFAQLTFQQTEKTIQNYADQIWSTS